MKIIFYLIIIAIAITIGLYFLNPALFQSIKNNVTNKVSNVIPIEVLSNKTTIYKWKNDKGELQISNTPPPNGVKYKTEEVPHGTNIMPSEALTGK